MDAHQIHTLEDCLLIKKCLKKFAHLAKITALHSQLAFEGKGKFSSHLVRGRHQPSTQYKKQTKKVKQNSLENGMNAAPDTDKLDS